MSNKPQMGQKASTFEEKRGVPRKVAEDRSGTSESRDSDSAESLERRGSSDPPPVIDSQSTGQGTAIPKPAFRKRNKVSDVTMNNPSAVDSGNDSSGSAKSRKTTWGEETAESNWKKFWEAHRERFKGKPEEAATKEEVVDDVSAEADAVFRKAIEEMRFEGSTGDQASIRSRDVEEESVEESGDKNNVLEETSSDAADVEAPPRRSRQRAQVKEHEALAAGQDTSEGIAEEAKVDRLKDDEGRCPSDSSESSFFVSLTDEEKSRLEGRIRGDRGTRKWSSLENLRTKESEGPSGARIEGLSIERPVRGKEKRTIGSLKSSFEKKMGSVERMVEDHMERILEESVEKHPWLLPIETWIMDHCRPSGSQTAILDRRGAAGESEEAKSSDLEVDGSRAVRQSFDFKYTNAGNEDEPRIESRWENLKKLGRAGSPKQEKSGFDAAHLISRLRKAEHAKADDTGAAKPLGVLEMKDAKHHDLFDKLKDNVREKMEDIHRYFQRTNRLADVNRRLKSQIWSSVVTIVLVEAKNLLPMDIDGLSDPFVKFRLGTEKYKSKVVHKTLNPVWLEQFDLHLYEDPYLGQELEVTVWDRDKSHQDDLMGRATIDLATLERETTHRLWRDLEDGAGNIFLLLTISGTTASETISDLAAHEETPREREQLYQRYCIRNTMQRMRDVGHLTVKVFRAQGLAAADLGGKSDPFCVLELVNARLQTQTEYKTLAPNWQKIFTFNVKDINSVLEVTVYDEDRDHKVEFLGRVAIPLLRIRNGEKRWYALKDKKLRGRAKGSSPQILLELNVVWNVFRACMRTLNPREKKYMEPEIKFKRQVFLRNVLRLKAIIIIFIDIGKYVQSCWEWESKMRSIIAFIIFIFGCYYFEPYMIPGAALLILLKYYLVAMITGTPLSHTTSHFHDEVDEGPTTPGDDDDDEDDKDKEEKKSLKERLQAIQEVTQTVQNSIGYIASLCERVKNLFNFTVPYLSYVAIILTILAVAVLYLIPTRFLILVWGINKFFRKITRPHSVPNNELLDLVSRVPDDEELLNYRELKPLPTADCEKGGLSASPGPSNMTRREQRKRHKAA
ncbi:multiple C2 domain and transmembrane region protein isoform X2 [Andrena cerasifolii]|uniref:multiple C2 domain and transmembrane region protein isoform X2 n=1 Tax=Andrena cerasifolii TaxID=2819439 RepID=UPI0040384845